MTFEFAADVFIVCCVCMGNQGCVCVFSSVLESCCSFIKCFIILDECFKVKSLYLHCVVSETIFVFLTTFLMHRSLNQTFLKQMSELIQAHLK